MKARTARFLVALALVCALPLPAAAATVSQNCNATVQGIGACGAGDNGEAGVLIAYWVSTTDDAPGDPNVASNAADLREAICANLATSSGTCTTAGADGALRRMLAEWVRIYRDQKAKAALAAPPAVALDAQGNP